LKESDIQTQQLETQEKSEPVQTLDLETPKTQQLPTESNEVRPWNMLFYFLIVA